MARTIAKDYDVKRELILEKAAMVFAREGYGRASVSQVAQACGISKANIYHYYSSKDEVLFAILETHLQGLRDRVLALDLGGMAPAEQLRAAVAEILFAYEGADDAHKVQAMGMEALDPALQKQLRGYQRDLVQHLSEILETCAPQVFTGDGAKLRAVTMSVFGMLNWFYMWQSGAGRGARRDYAALVSTMTLKGITAL
ncbi:MAG: TetR/AcrR family transcriptional regulator [Sulfitobacter sp.]